MTILRRTAFVVVGLGSALAVAPAHALYLDRAKQQGQCAAMSRDGSYRVADGLVGGYVAGVVDQSLAASRGRPSFCIPAAADLRQVRDAVCRSVAKQADRRMDGAAALVRLALADAFPCRR